mgnify:CR=1 FL=1
MERDWSFSAGKQFYLPGRFQGPVQSNRRIRPRRRAVPPCRARPCVAPCRNCRDVGLQDMLRTDKTRDKVANLEPGGVGVCQNDKPLRCSNALEQPLQRAVLEHPEASVVRIVPSTILLRRAASYLPSTSRACSNFSIYALPASASSHSAFCIKRSASSLLLFRSVSSLCRMCRQSSSWARLKRSAVFR